MNSSSLTLPRIGIAGWFGQDRRGYQSIEYLSHFVNAIEIPLEAEQLPSRSTVQVWTRLVNHNSQFRFTVKLPSSVCEQRNLKDDHVRELHEVIQPLQQAGLLGAVLFEFPWAFRFTEENRDFLIRARRIFHRYPIAVEMRHASWAAEEALGTFIDFHLSFVNIDQPAYTKALQPTSFLTAPVGYVRMHGRTPVRGRVDRSANECDYTYNTTELTEWKARIDRLSAFSSDCYVVFTNRSGGKNVVNAIEMTSLMQGKTVRSAGLPALSRHAVA